VILPQSGNLQQHEMTISVRIMEFDTEKYGVTDTGTFPSVRCHQFVLSHSVFASTYFERGGRYGFCERLYEDMKPTPVLNQPPPRVAVMVAGTLSDLHVPLSIF
jgi:hypothetical protein